MKKLEKLTEKDVIEPADFDVIEEFVVPMQSTIADIVNKHIKEVDKMFFETLAKYGYSREWVLDPDNRDRILIRAFKGDYYLCNIDNVDLFNMIVKHRYSDLNPYNVTVNVTVTYIAPLPEEGSNEEI